MTDGRRVEIKIKSSVDARNVSWLRGKEPEYPHQVAVVHGCIRAENVPAGYMAGHFAAVPFPSNGFTVYMFERVEDVARLLALPGVKEWKTKRVGDYG